MRQSCLVAAVTMRVPRLQDARNGGPAPPGGGWGGCRRVVDAYEASTVVGSMERVAPPCATSMRRGLAASATGMVTVSTPFS